MPVDDHVNVIVFQHTQIGLSQDRRRRAEEDIRNVGGEQTTAPTITDGSSDSMLQDVDWILIVTDVCTMQAFHDLAVDSSRQYPGLFPALLPFSRSTLGQDDHAFLLAKL